MPKQQDIDLDLSVLVDFADEKSGRLPLKRALASNKFAQVGINLFRNQENNTIWQLETGDDGLDYIIKADTTNDGNMVVESSEDGNWTAIADSTKRNITVSHNGVPLCRFSASDYNFDEESVHDFQRYLMREVADEEFGDSLKAHSTGKCPLCNTAVVDVGFRKIGCVNLSCKYAQRAYKTRQHDMHSRPQYSGGETGNSIPVYKETGEFVGDFNVDKVHKLVDQGILELQTTPTGLKAVRIKKL